ncbi:MAG: hypothetical protein JO219_11240 [Candidatus Eremiobacteraeota bacterium]|nr:hypothetical protein [Candidatus Eremiobacteraeota bacterium]MBV8366126.1 hypothetical protein [Candidatus Eremiobacteraeota bacterium]
MRTTALWYALGVLVMVGGVAAAVAGTIDQLKRLEASFVRFVVPGAYDMQVAQSGQYVLYYEYETAVNGESFQTPESTDITCRVADPGGKPLQVVPATFETEYAFGGHTGRAIGQFLAAAPGVYVITCAHGSGKGEREALAVAPPLAGGFAAAVLKLIALAFVSVGAGLTILIAALVMRPHAKRPVFET